MATALVFAVDTLVRFRDGRILVHTTTARLPAFETDQRMLIGWICQFARPDAALRIVVPDIEKCIAAYAANDRMSFASRRETWDWCPESATRLEDFHAYAGVGAVATARYGDEYYSLFVEARAPGA